MENPKRNPSGEQGENDKTQEHTRNESKEWLFDFPSAKKIPPVNTVNIMKQNEEILKDCRHEPDNIIVNIKSTSNLDDKNNYNRKMTEEKKKKMETVDLSDLTFSCNDCILNDCNCFEQASQLVDPSLKDSESTPFSFNNSDSVQLFRFSLSQEESNLFSKSHEKGKSDIGKNDHYNFYHVFELFDTNMKDESVQYKSSMEEMYKRKDGKKMKGPIQKGRRYLPKFKEKVLEYAKNHTFKETASHFKINCNTITEWSRESKRLSLKRNTLPGPDSNTYKTDIVVTPETKTEIILFNDVIRFETDFNEPFLKNIESDLPSVEMNPDERFIKWMETKRSEGKQVSRQEVFLSAKCCMRRMPPCWGQEKPSWFVSWFKRFNKALKNLMSPPDETEKYIKYPSNFKLEVALYARTFTKNSAARVFNVPRKRIFDWVNCLNPVEDSFGGDTGEEMDGSAIKDKPGGLCKSKKDKIRSKIYTELHLWYQKRCLNGVKPRSPEIKEKAREIFSSYGINHIKFSDGWLQKFCQRMNIKLKHSEDDRLLLWVLTQLDNNVSLSHQEITNKSSSLIKCKGFKGSKGWTLRFLKRHRDLLQFSPTVRDPLPQIVQEKLDLFWDGFKQSLITFQLKPGSVGSMDEIPLSFSFPEEGKPTSLPLLRKTGFENCQGVVILCALSNGRVLPPTVVFKGTGPKQLLSDQNGDVLILYEEHGLITSKTLETWFSDIWLSCAGSPSLLLVDSFLPHCTSEFRKLSARENCLLQVIPEGCSSRFQPLDVEVTPLFKESIKEDWKEFSLNSGLTKTTKSYRCPDQDTILRWVQKAHEKIKKNPVSIINSFKTTGLLQ